MTSYKEKWGTSNPSQKTEMFDFGPLHEQRHEIEQALKLLPLQTGDILYRASNAKGPLGLPFSRLVARATKSDYSHAAIVLMQNEEIYVLEVNDQGTLKLRFIDWLDTCYTKHFSVYRLKEINQLIIDLLEKEIRQVLKNDPDYDFNFSDPDKYYCTESVALIYERIGHPLIKPQLIKDVVSPLIYYILKTGSWLFSLFSETSLSFNQPLYFVGNEQHGMMSSEKTFCVYSQ